MASSSLRHNICGAKLFNAPSAANRFKCLPPQPYQPPAVSAQSALGSPFDPPRQPTTPQPVKKVLPKDPQEIADFWIRLLTYVITFGFVVAGFLIGLSQGIPLTFGGGILFGIGVIMQQLKRFLFLFGPTSINVDNTPSADGFICAGLGLCIVLFGQFGLGEVKVFQAFGDRSKPDYNMRTLDYNKSHTSEIEGTHSSAGFGFCGFGELRSIRELAHEKPRSIRRTDRGRNHYDKSNRCLVVVLRTDADAV